MTTLPDFVLAFLYEDIIVSRKRCIHSRVFFRLCDSCFVYIDSHDSIRQQNLNTDIHELRMDPSARMQREEMFRYRQRTRFQQLLYGDAYLEARFKTKQAAGRKAARRARKPKAHAKASKAG